MSSQYDVLKEATIGKTMVEESEIGKIISDAMQNNNRAEDTISSISERLEKLSRKRKVDNGGLIPTSQYQSAKEGESELDRLAYENISASQLNQKLSDILIHLKQII